MKIDVQMFKISLSNKFFLNFFLQLYIKVIFCLKNNLRCYLFFSSSICPEKEEKH